MKGLKKMMSRSFRTAVLGGFLLLGGGGLSAQSSLTLGDALAATLDNNFDILIEDTRSGIARNNNTWEAAGRYPTVDLILQNGNRLSNVDNPASFLNGQFSNVGATGTVDVNWNVFSGFRVQITKERLAELERQSEGNVALVVENSLQAVILQYYDCVVQKEQLRILEFNLSLSRDRLQYVQSKRDLGSGTTFELLNIQTAYQTDSSNLLLQELAYANALRSLGQLIGLPADSAVATKDGFRRDFPAYDLENLRSKMFSNNLTLRNQFINLEILQKDMELARAGRSPSIGLNLGSTYSTNRFNLEGRDPASGTQLDYYANFSLNFSLYNGGSVRRSIANAEISQQVARIGIDQMEQDMDYQLRNALALYDTRRNLLGLAQETRALAEQNLDIAEAKFKNGTVSSFDFRDVQIAYLNSYFGEIQALYNITEAETALLRLVGGIVDMVEER